jgi:hypothetical protein
MKKPILLLPLITALISAVLIFTIQMIFIHFNPVAETKNPFGTSFTGLIMWYAMYELIRDNLENGRFASPIRDSYLTSLYTGLTIIPMTLAYTLMSSYQPQWTVLSLDNPLILTAINVVGLIIVAAIALALYRKDTKSTQKK